MDNIKSWHKWNTVEILLHITAWVAAFAFPHMLITYSHRIISPLQYLCMLGAPTSLAIIFYCNYIYLVPKLLFAQKTRQFILYNIILYIFANIFLYAWLLLCNYDEAYLTNPMKMLLHLRNIFLNIVITVFAILINQSIRWRQAVSARQKAELRQSEAELQSLRNQINPHFLLNTLNNIYVLIGIDQQKAQASLMELSKMLRHLLYDNKEIFTSLDKEIEFMQQYIELMRIRLGDNVDLRCSYDIPNGNTLLIAPLIFLSLVENSFKHGISPTLPSHIYIHFKADQETGEVSCILENSNFPTLPSKRSGSGVGLEQVQKRLDINYPNRYHWEKGISPDGKTFRSTLTIQTKNKNI